MKTHIALLRGINVGGHKKVPMAELRQIFVDCGFSDVASYIQTGNVIFKTKKTNKTNLEKTIHINILKHFGFDVSVLITTKLEIERILLECPFSEEKKEESHFILLKTVPNQELISQLQKETYPNEEFFITNTCVYLHGQKGYRNAKCGTNFFEHKLKVSATARNFKTMMKLLSLSNI